MCCHRNVWRFQEIIGSCKSKDKEKEKGFKTNTQITENLATRNQLTTGGKFRCPWDAKRFLFVIPCDK